MHPPFPFRLPNEVLAGSARALFPGFLTLCLLPPPRGLDALQL